MLRQKEPSESLLLVTTPGFLRNKDNLEIPSPFVVGIEVLGKTAVYHYQIDTITDTTTSTIELPATKAQRVQELFRKLYSPERDTHEFDCLSGLDFMISARDNVELREHEYDNFGPIASDDLEKGEPYIVVSEDKVSHGMLATDNTRVLHIAGPQGDMGYTPASDILQLWQGELCQVVAAAR